MVFIMIKYDDYVNFTLINVKWNSYLYVYYAFFNILCDFDITLM